MNLRKVRDADELHVVGLRQVWTNAILPRDRLLCPVDHWAASHAHEQPILLTRQAGRLREKRQLSSCDPGRLKGCGRGHIAHIEAQIRHEPTNLPGLPATADAGLQKMDVVGVVLWIEL